MLGIACNVVVRHPLVGMAHIDPELERLEKAERDTHSRSLRLANFNDATVVAAAEALWKSARVNLDTYLIRNRAIDR